MDEHGWRPCDAYNLQTANEDIFGRSSHINAGCEFPTLAHGCGRSRTYFGHVWTSRYSTCSILQRCCPWSNLTCGALAHGVSSQLFAIHAAAHDRHASAAESELWHVVTLSIPPWHDKAWSMMLFMVLFLGTGIPGYIMLVFLCRFDVLHCVKGQYHTLPSPHTSLHSIRQANLDAPHRIGEFLWGMLYCRHPSWVQVLFSTSPWKKHVASRQSCEFSLFASCQCVRD